MPNVQNPGGGCPLNQDEMMPDQGEMFPPNQNEMESVREIPPSDQEGSEVVEQDHLVEVQKIENATNKFDKNSLWI